MATSSAKVAADLAAQLNPKSQLQESRECSGDSQVISLPKTRIHTLDQLLTFCEVDLAIWEVERFVCNKWEVAMKPPATTEYVEAKHGKYPAWKRLNDEPIVEPLYQVKAWLRRRKEVVAARRELEQMKLDAKIVARFPKSYTKSKSTGKMLEINIPDLHAGKLAWAKETGQGNYDLPIAVAVFGTALETLLERVKAHSFERVLFVVGNDLLHSDGTKGQTFGGTPLDNDARYHKVFGEVRTMTVAAIERLRSVAPVDVVMVPGNHDTLSVWHLGDSLECYFHKYRDVSIDNSPRQRKYYRFGDVMLMLTHGDKAKRLDYPLLMATEESAMFGATKFREAHTGHLHTTKLDEQHGVRVRILPALCDADAWHSELGYVNNLRAAEAFVWSKDEGLIGTAIYTVRGEK